MRKVMGRRRLNNEKDYWEKKVEPWERICR
jgi:hypothetical protein